MVVVFLWVVGILLAIQLILLISLILWKTQTLSAEKKIQTEVDRLAPQYRAYLKGGHLEKPEIPKQGGRFRAAVLESILDGLMSEASSEEEKVKVTELAEQNLSNHYGKILRKGKWAERVNTLYFIEDFRMFSLREAAFSHLKSLRKRDEEYRQCLRAAAILQDERVIDVLVNEQALSAAFTKEILFRLDDRLLTTLSGRISVQDAACENLLFAFIGINGDLKNERFFPFVEGLMLDERKEVRIKAMRSLCKYEKLEDTSKLEAFFKSDYWEERMYAAKLTGACRLNEFKEALIELFSDPVWWVRFAAAENIYNLEDGAGSLKYIGATSEDTYARDIANHMLTRKGGDSR